MHRRVLAQNARMLVRLMVIVHKSALIAECRCDITLPKNHDAFPRALNRSTVDGESP
jgi:hypothetical protein